MPVALEWLIWAFATSFVVCAGLVFTQKWHGRLTLDHDTQGVQKLHKLPVPRIGGVALLIGLLAVGIKAWLDGDPNAVTAALLLASAVPAFAAGLLEDLTKRVSVRQRLIASFVSAALAIWLLDTCLTRLDIPLLDGLMDYAVLAVPFTAFAVGGVTNAVNIIDGLNGLASGCVVLMLAGLGAIAWLHDDVLVTQLCMAGIGATLGFMLLNYPFGRIFLGDGGAYLAGFWLGECAVLLLARNPEVSTWAPLLACFYPVLETVFSMYRRVFIRKTYSGRPDMVHMHHLLLRRVVPRRLGLRDAAWVRHGLTSSLLWAAVLACQLAAVAGNEHSLLLLVAAAAFAGAYLWTYGRIVRACAPVAGGRDSNVERLPASMYKQPERRDAA